MKIISGNRKHVFPAFISPHNRPMSNESANRAISRMGYKGKLVAHGLRSIASTAANESQKFSYDVIETALAHVDKNTTRSSYNNADYFEARKVLMNWWGNYVDDAKKQSLQYVENSE